MTDDSKVDKTAGGPAPDDKPAVDDKAVDNKLAAAASSTEENGASVKPEAEKAASAKPAAGEEGGSPPAPARAALSEEEKEAKAKAAAEARAARAKERAAKAEAEAPDAPKEPSPNQPLLDRLVALLQEIPDEAVQEAFINEKGGHLPCLSIKPEAWPATAEMLRTHPELRLNYLRNVSGTDMETHMEVVYHLISLESKREYCVKVKTNREAPSVPSVTSVWPTANWNEREIYDLLGIDFPGHPDLRRIMMADDWVGHPLRKDYEPLDPEV